MTENDDSDRLTMRSVSKALGVNSRVLRAYCNAGLVPGLRYVRTSRVFTPEQVDWLKILIGLSSAGFTKADLRKYARLAQASTPEATTERLAMLKTHKRQVWQDLEDLQATIDFLERQEELLEGGLESL